MKRLFYFLSMLTFWLLITYSLSWPNLVAGAGVAALTTLIFSGYFFDVETRKLLQPARYFWFLLFLPVFLWECLKANFDVAYRVIHPRLPIRPGIVKVKLNLKTELARTMLANAITMTPGTIAVDIIDDYIYVHWIYITSLDPADYAPVVSGRFERYLKKIFE